MPDRKDTERLIGESGAFLRVLEDVSHVAALSKPVLVVGERGTGKELIAARLHYLSARWDQTFAKMNCAAISDSLLESELFGHEAGAFTGATRMHRGRFERADGGTLFLDELANVSGLVQEKILRVIEYGEFERLGGTKTIQTDIRLVAATNEDLPTLADRGEFRSDLLDRLAFDVITLPPLRERRDDILLLAEYFALNMALELERELFAGFSPEAQETLLEYAWPGNIRELKNVVERSVYRSADPEAPVDTIVIDPFESPWRPGIHAAARDVDRPEAGQPAEPPVADTHALPMDFKEHIRDYEVNLIQRALEEAKFNQRKTAELLGMTYHQLRGYLRKYEMLESKDSADNAAG